MGVDSGDQGAKQRTRTGMEGYGSAADRANQPAVNGRAAHAAVRHIAGLFSQRDQ